MRDQRRAFVLVLWANFDNRLAIIHHMQEVRKARYFAP